MPCEQWVQEGGGRGDLQNRVVHPEGRGGPEWVRSPGLVGREKKERHGEGPWGGKGRFGDTVAGRLREQTHLQSQIPASQKGGRAVVRALSAGWGQNAAGQGARGRFGCEDSPGRERPGGAGVGRVSAVGDMDLGGWMGLGLSSKIPARDPDGSWLSMEQSLQDKGDRRGGQGRSCSRGGRAAHITQQSQLAPPL